MGKIVAVSSVVLLALVVVFDIALTGNQAILGPRGDFFAGFLNPIIGLITLGVLYATLVTMKKEFSHGIDAFKKSQDLIEGNNRQQRFEDTFFSMLNVLISMGDIVYKLEDDFVLHDGREVKKSTKKSLVSEFYSLLILKYRKDSRIKLLSGHKQINSLFRMLFQILKHVDDYYEVSSKNYDNKEIKDQAKKYVNILRATLDSDTYHLLLLNCMVDDKHDDFYKYKQYLAVYEFLEHISINDSLVFDRQESLPVIQKSNSSYALFLCHVKRSYLHDDMKSIFGKSDVVSYLEAIDCNNVTGPIDPSQY